MKIVIVDDNTVNLTLLSALVKKIELDNCEAIPFISPGEGLAWSIKYHPDLIVVDYMMPDGLEFSTTIRKYYPDIPIIMVGASDLREIRHSMLKIGVEYMLKPIERTEFLIRAKNLLELGQKLKRLETLKKFLELRELDHFENDGLIAIKSKDPLVEDSRIYFGFSEGKNPTLDDAIDFLVRDTKANPQFYEGIL